MKWTFSIACNHCTDASCVKVCPSGASARRADGIVSIDAERCIGCQLCITACQYQRNSLLDDGEREYFPGQGLTAPEIIGKMLYPHRVGAATKCNFCKERIDSGMRQGMKPGIDRPATPACVNTCPVKAITFGDLDDPESNVSKLLVAKKGPGFLTEPAIKLRSVHYVD
jgi:phenylacetyl-CoA:acceptor oxidoreductase subunit 1